MTYSDIPPPWISVVARIGDWYIWDAWRRHTWDSLSWGSTMSPMIAFRIRNRLVQGKWK